MTGIYQHTLDAKGRLFIPAKLREELGDTFYVTVSPEMCLSAYSQENWKVISEKAAAMTNLQQRKVRPPVRVCGPLRSRRAGTYPPAAAPARLCRPDQERHRGRQQQPCGILGQHSLE